MCTYSPAPQLINTPPRPQPSRYTPASRRGGWGRGKSECGVHHRSKHVAGTCCGLANLQTSHCAASSAFASCPHCCTSSAAVLQPGRPACAPVGDEYRRLRRSGLAEKYWEWRTAGWKRQPTCSGGGGKPIVLFRCSAGSTTSQRAQGRAAPPRKPAVRQRQGRRSHAQRVPKLPGVATATHRVRLAADGPLRLCAKPAEQWHIVARGSARRPAAI